MGSTSSRRALCGRTPASPSIACARSTRSRVSSRSRREPWHRRRCDRERRARAVAALPAHYRLDGHSAFALDPARPLVEIALYDATGGRLIDGSLAIADALPVTPAGWDQVALDPTSPHHALAVTADSMPAQTLAVDLDGAIDRVEKVNEDNRLCYHAYHGATEIAAALAVLGTTDPSAINCEPSATMRQ